MSNLIDNRQIRVFISSTFQDMQDERNYLMKHTFPMLRKKAAGRDVTLTELDLRWGITPEESESGKVVEICLREVENSIPFFVGIIGDRYGWVPAENDLTENTKERFPQVKDYLERRLSVTEMEMQFGVLARKEDDLHAYFYIKEETTTAEKDNPEMLERLKEEVKKSQYPSSTYTSLEDLGSQVEQAFTSLLDRLFPEGNITELERERIGQRSFMRQLCQNYIRDDNNYKALDDWMGDWEQHQLVVTGASGLGKSALIANWTNEKLNDPNRNYNIICHFTGNGGSQCGHEHIMKVLADEIKDVYGWTNEKESIGMAQTAEIRMNTKDGMQSAGFSSENNKNAGEKELDNLFVKVASEGGKPLLIILDAVNQIVDRDNAKLLNWLPVPPRNIKILFSTLEDDRTMEVFHNRRYPVFTLHPLSEDNRRRLANDYLHHYGKKLTDAQITRIVTDSQCENTMVLKTLLDELINFGVYEKLDSRIDYYLSRDTIEDFYQALLASYESDYGMDFVKHVLSLISVSKNGLSEDEILSLTQVRPYHWSQFHCAILSHMTVRNGLVGFSHTYIQNAVDSRYINNDKTNELQCREEIVQSMVNADSSRSQIEIPFQLFRMQAYERLHDFLLNADVFNVLYDENEYELGDYWSSLTANGYKLSDYLPFIKEADTGTCQRFVVFFRDVMADYEVAKSVAELFLEIAKLTGEESEEYGHALNELGIICGNLCEYQEAMEFYGNSLEIAKKKYGEHNILTASSYNNLGGIYFELNDFNKALEFFEKALKIRLNLLGEHQAQIASLYNNIGGVYFKLNKYNKALRFFEKALEINKIILGENHVDTAKMFNSISNIYIIFNNYDKALECQMRALEIKKNNVGTCHPSVSTSFFNLGVIYHSLGNYPKALESYELALEIDKKTLGEYNSATASSFSNIGSIYDIYDDYQKALEYQEKALKIRLSLFGEKHSAIASSYSEIGSTYESLCDFPKALEYQEKALKIRLSLFGEKHSAIASSYSEIGSTYESLCDFPKALGYYQKALNIRVSIFGEKHSDTATSYNNLGSIYYSIGDYQNSLMCFEKSLRIREKIYGKYHPSVATSLYNMGSIFDCLCDYHKALEYKKGGLIIDEKNHGEYHSATAASYNNIGLTYYRIGEYDNALEYFQKGLKIRKEIFGYPHPDLAESYNNIGMTYGSLDDYYNALDYIFEALKIYTEFFGNNHSSTATSLYNIGCIYDRLVKEYKALEYYQKALSIQKQLFDLNHPDVVKTIDNIGSVYRSMGDYENALIYRKKSLQYAIRKFGEENIETAIAYNNVGAQYRDLGKYDEALEYVGKALSIAEKLNHIEAISGYHNRLGRIYAIMGKKDEAVSHFHQSISLVPEDNEEAIDSRKRLEQLSENS